MDFNKLPQELKEHPYWCLWKYETVDGRRTKVPYQVSGWKASVSNIRTFFSFKAVLKHISDYDGVAILVTGDIVAVDIDHCISEDGELSEMAQEIVNVLNTYTETSPSGKGLRIIGKAPGFIYDRDRYFINNQAIGLEVYCADAVNKTCSITGKTLLSAPLRDISRELPEVLEKYMRRPVSEGRQQKECLGSFLTDDRVIEKACAAANGNKFLALWNGDISGYASQSEADLALCTYLAFWCGGDEEQIDRLMRQSGLYREKWEREDYSVSTIKRAVSSVSEFYKPMRISSATEDFGGINDRLNELYRSGSARYEKNDIGAGRLFADVFKAVARYAEDRKKWFVYDGSCWVADTAGLRVAELGKTLADALLIYAATLHDENERTDMIKWCGKWVQRRFRETYIKEAQSVYPVSMQTFDRNPYLFNCNNCTIDVRTGEAHEHNPEDYITKVSPVSYDPSAEHPRWNRFINEIMSGDEEKADYLQKALGYCLSGDNDLECMFICYGETTRNGKGTLLESILRVMGNYGAAVRPDTIAQKNQSSSHAPSEDIARLAGIRFANISEPGKGMILDSALIKTMTGNDTLNARFLNENSFDFKPEFKMYINTNYLPVIRDMTVFSSNRVIIIPFDRHFEESEQDGSLKTEFASPEAQSAILNWMLRGYRMLRREGMSKPACVREAICEYYHESNRVMQFLEERLIEDSKAEVKTSAVYDSYSDWCRSNGCHAENNRNFITELRKLGNVVRRRPRNGGDKTTLLEGYRLQDCPEFLQ